MGGAGDALADQGEDLGEEPVHLVGDGDRAARAAAP